MAEEWLWHKEQEEEPVKVLGRLGGLPGALTVKAHLGLSSRCWVGKGEIYKFILFVVLILLSLWEKILQVIHFLMWYNCSCPHLPNVPWHLLFGTELESCHSKVVSYLSTSHYFQTWAKRHKLRLILKHPRRQEEGRQEKGRLFKIPFYLWICFPYQAECKKWYIIKASETEGQN